MGGVLLYKKKKRGGASHRSEPNRGTTRPKNTQEQKLRVLETTVRGFANRRRIEILMILERRSERSVVDLSEQLDINFKTAAVHIQRLASAGLIEKRSDGTRVRHTVTPRGIAVLKFLRTLE
jgi:DNA-binding MarR family transcriptional regulator